VLFDVGLVAVALVALAALSLWAPQFAEHVRISEARTEVLAGLGLLRRAPPGAEPLGGVRVTSDCDTTGSGTARVSVSYALGAGGDALAFYRRLAVADGWRRVAGGTWDDTYEKAMGGWGARLHILTPVVLERDASGRERLVGTGRVHVVATEADPDCPWDHLYLPFLDRPHDAPCARCELGHPRPGEG
jgi:hypothetical protein